MAWVGLFIGNDEKTANVLDAEMLIWVVNYGSPGGLNDINILHKSIIFDEIMSGKMVPSYKYMVKGVERD